MKIQRPLPAADLAEVLASTAALWPQWRGARIFLTGATGFFGSWLLESLLAANHRFGLGIEATVLSRDPDGFARRVPHLGAASAISWVRGSAVDLEFGQVIPARRGPGQKPSYDAVIHLATEADGARTLAVPGAARQVITGSTERALEFAVAAGARRFLFASSGSVYGLQPPTLALLTEDFPSRLNPEDEGSAYAISGNAKRSAEALCLAFGARHGIETVIARCFAFAGPGLPMDGKFALGNFLADALAGRDIVVAGDGTPVRSYLYATDLASWLWTLLARGRPGRPYNVGSEKAVTIRETAEAVRREVAPGSKVHVLTASDPARPAHRYVPATARAREELQLRETIGLAEAIRRTAAWCRL